MQLFDEWNQLEETEIVVTIEQYRRMCAEWTGDPGEFCWLVQHGDIAGVSQRGIADEFEFAPSTVSRWATGEALPHKRIQKLVIAGLEKRAGRLEYAAANAVPLVRKTSVHGQPVPQG
jgi:hypothetical protein